MKIGICTCYHENPNYGGQLQGFALQFVLSRMGHDAELVPYKLNLAKHRVRMLAHVGASYSMSFFEDRMNRRIWNANERLRSMSERRLEMFRSFERSVPHCELVDNDGLRRIVDSFDAFITGSDQVWNPQGWNDYFLLEFAGDGKIKLSYAASMVNTKLTRSETKRLRSALASYKGISLREPGAASLINSLEPPLDQKAQVHVDPTLLLTGEEWETALGLPEDPFLPEPYALIYMVHKTSNEFRAAIEWCRRLSVRPVVTALGCPRDRAAIDAIEPYIDLSPASWVHAVRDATVVITDSFHGSVFAVSFERPLCAITRRASGKDGRIPNLLRMAEREDCQIVEGETIDPRPAPSTLSHTFVEERNRSFAYLAGILGGAHSAC